MPVQNFFAMLENAHERAKKVHCYEKEENIMRRTTDYRRGVILSDTT